MRKFFCCVLVATAWWSNAFAAKNFFSTTPEEDTYILMFVISILVLPGLFSFLSYWYSQRWLKIIGAIFTVPVLMIAMLTVYFGFPEGIILLLLVALNIYLISTERTRVSVAVNDSE